MTKYDKNHQKKIGTLQYEIYRGTYFTIYLYSFSNKDKLCPIILNYALLKNLTCQDLFTVANYLR